IAIFAGGNTPTIVSTVDDVTIIDTTTTASADSFGTLSVARTGLSACSSSTRGVFGGGATPTKSNVIDFTTIDLVGVAPPPKTPRVLEEQAESPVLATDNVPKLSALAVV
ncbi:MAG: hypothetical protein ACKO96_06850, partial [Flammeovirgaceae bacterium]